LTNSLFTTKHFTFSENLKEKQPSHSSKFFNKGATLRSSRAWAPKIINNSIRQEDNLNNFNRNSLAITHNFKNIETSLRSSSAAASSLINWYNLIGIKEIKSGIVGIKIEINGRMTKMKKASRTKSNRFLKGRFSSKINKNIFIIDKGVQKMIGKNGSIGIKIFLGNELQIIR